MRKRDLPFYAMLLLAVALGGACADSSRSDSAEPDSPTSTEPAAAAPEESVAVAGETSGAEDAEDDAYRPMPREPQPGVPEVDGEAPLPPPRVHPRADEVAADEADGEISDQAADATGEAGERWADVGVAGGIVEDASVAEDLATLAAGTELEIELIDSVSTRDASAGQTVRARFARGVDVDGRRVPLKRWTLVGRVTLVLHPERKGDRAGGLELAFETVVTDTGDEYPLAAVATGVAGDTKKRNVGVIAGGALVGAIIGKKKGDTDEALVGAAAGAAAGAGIVRALPGKHLDLPEGAEMVLTLLDDARLPYRDR
jgi:hypothetical protein